MDVQKLFALKKPCGNCPFLKEGAIPLAEGRVEEIIENLVADDSSSFYCHKTVHNSRTGGEWTDDGDYKPSGNESACFGAMVYLAKAGRPNIQMRLGFAFGLLNRDRLVEQADNIIG